MSIYSETIPYFYIIRHIATGKMYAGSRWAKRCNPDELLKIDGYLTSSNIIRSIISVEGIEAFEILRIDTNCDGMHPHDYESEFLQTNECARSENWFNGHNNNSRMMFGETEFYEKTKTTWLEKYGVDHPSKSEKILEEKKERCEQKYGVEYFFQTQQFKEKAKDTFLEKYGVKHCQQNSEIRSKVKQTNLEKYGYEYGLSSPKVIAKRIETLEQKYGSGVTNVFQTKEVKDKMIATYQQKYGANNHMSSDIGYSNYKKKLEEKFGLGITNVFQIKFLCLLGNKKEYTKAAITRWYPEFKQYY